MQGLTAPSHVSPLALLFSPSKRPLRLTLAHGCSATSSSSVSVQGGCKLSATVTLRSSVFFPGGSRHLTVNTFQPTTTSEGCRKGCKAPVKLAEADQLDAAKDVLETVLAFKGLNSSWATSHYYGGGKKFGHPARDATLGCACSGKPSQARNQIGPLGSGRV